MQNPSKGKKQKPTSDKTEMVKINPDGTMILQFDKNVLDKWLKWLKNNGKKSNKGGKKKTEIKIE